MATFIVAAPGEWFLRGTTLTHRERAQEFATREAAEAALLRAKKFMKPAVYKAAHVIPTEG
jgi:hypothetical protein